MPRPRVWSGYSITDVRKSLKIQKGTKFRPDDRLSSSGLTYARSSVWYLLVLDPKLDPRVLIFQRVQGSQIFDFVSIDPNQRAG